MTAAEDDCDEEEIFERMCLVVSRRLDIPTEQVKVIAESAGVDAYYHCGIVALLETVRSEMGRKP